MKQYIGSYESRHIMTACQKLYDKFYNEIFEGISYLINQGADRIIMDEIELNEYLGYESFSFVLSGYRESEE